MQLLPYPLILALVCPFMFVRADCTIFPTFNVTLKPVFEPGNYSLEGTVYMGGSFATNESLVSLPIIIANAPSAQYPPDGLVASDLSGSLALSSHDVASGPAGLPTRYWVTTRPTNGPVSIQFTAYMEMPDPAVHIGPLFGIRNQTEGILGSLWALVPTPGGLNGDIYDISLAWNMSEVHDAAWTWGVGPGPISIRSTMSNFLSTFFAVGRLSKFESEVQESSSDFGMYWFDEPPFTIDELADVVDRMFQYSTEFWQDVSNDPYRIFIRKNIEQGSGGTAGTRSFIFGYRDAASITTQRLKTLISHEMTHNWPSLRVGTNAEASRYNEGMAEYYSLRLLWRSGVFTADEFIVEMNDRVSQYYNNPTIGLSDEEAQSIAWEIRDAQRIPYGRGLIHLTNIDAQMRAKFNGSESLDRLALGFQDYCRGVGGACGNEDWFQILKENLGQEAVDEWTLVSTGEPLIVPQAGSLGPCFDVVQNGTNPLGYMWVAKEGVNISSPVCQI